MKQATFDTPFQNCIPSLPSSLSDYDPFCDVRERGLSISALLKEKLLSDGKAYLHKPYAAIFATDYMKFKRTGDRSAFESLYFSRRFQLCALITAELAEGKGTFLDDIINGIYCIMEESSWVLPAHNTYIRDTPQLILPVPKKPVLDLFSCETAALLAMCSYLLKEKLDSISPLIADRIQSEILDRLATPYLNEHFWWMGNEEEPMCNWTPWCTQNALLSVFLLPFSNEMKRNAVIQAAYSLDCFLKDYGEDGCCDEGAQYYRHAGLCLFSCMEILNAVSGNAFASLFELQKIKNLASYIVHVRVGNGYYINFSDCSAKAGSMGVREFLFGKACGLHALMEASADDLYRDYEASALFSADSEKMNLFFRMLTITHATEVLAYHKQIADRTGSSAGDIFYPSVGLMIARSPRFVLAVKAGDNADNHNHNDTGSFTLYQDRSPVFVDIGVETYSQKTFSDKRYEIWTMQSSYHNLPTIAGLDQHDGAKYRATHVNCKLHDPVRSIFMQIEEAYPLPDKLSSEITYARTICLDPVSDVITLKDQTDCSDVVLNFITYDPPKQSGHENTYLLGNTVISFEGATLLDVETLPVTDERLKLAWDHDLYRIRLKMEASDFSMRISASLS